MGRLNNPPSFSASQPKAHRWCERYCTARLIPGPALPFAYTTRRSFFVGHMTLPSLSNEPRGREVLIPFVDVVVVACSLLVVLYYSCTSWIPNPVFLTYLSPLCSHSDKNKGSFAFGCPGLAVASMLGKWGRRMGVDAKCLFPGVLYIGLQNYYGINLALGLEFI
jgi:hypothetical protein